MQNLVITLHFLRDMARVWSPILAVGLTVPLTKMVHTARSNAAARATRRAHLANA